MIAGLTGRLRAFVDRLAPSETVTVYVTSVVVGIATALLAVAFIDLIGCITGLAYGPWGITPLVAIVVAPILGGLLQGPLLTRFVPEAKGSGIPEVMESVALRGGRMRGRVALGKVGAAALCIGSGGSAGREGPIVQAGSAVGSWVGQLLGLSQNRMRGLVACGAASGIAAAFNAPISGVIFATEVVLGEMNPGALGNIVIAAVSASVVSRSLLGTDPAFSVPAYQMAAPGEIFGFLAVGVASAVVAVALIRLVWWSRDRFDGSGVPKALRPAAGAALLAVVGLAGWLAFPSETAAARPGALPLDPEAAQRLPFVYGSGFVYIEEALTGEMPLLLMVALILAKPLATAFTFGSGAAGGVFAPCLFIGAMVGGAVGQVAETVGLSGLAASPGAMAVVGMASVFAGAARAPFTAILIVFELTGDYGLIVPLMAGVVTSIGLARRLYPESIYTVSFARRGVRLRQGRVRDVLDNVQVSEIMRPAATVPTNLPAPLLVNELQRLGAGGLAVVDGHGNLAGHVSLSDYRALAERGQVEELRVEDIAVQPVVTVPLDATASEALRRMAPRDLSRVIVVHPDNPERIVGVVGRNDVLRAYERAAVQLESEMPRQAPRPVAPPETQFIDAPIEPNSPLANLPVSGIELPREAILVSVRRGDELLIPHGTRSCGPAT